MASEWIAVMDKLPDAQKDVLRTTDPPATYDDMVVNDSWQQIFSVWSQFASGYNLSILPYLSAFYRWAQDSWGATLDGRIDRFPSVQDIAEASEKWFAYTLTGYSTELTEATKQASEFLNKVAEPTEASAEDLAEGQVIEAQEIAERMVSAVTKELTGIYSAFNGDIDKYGDKAATQGAAFEAGYINKIHERNKANIEALEDKEYLSLSIYKWAGNTLVLLGDHPAMVLNDLGSSNCEHETEIAKKKAVFGPGEFICPDPGTYLAEIQQEISDYCDSKKPVKKGTIPGDYRMG